MDGTNNIAVGSNEGRGEFNNQMFDMADLFPWATQIRVSDNINRVPG